MKRGIYTFTPNPVLDLGGAVHKVIPDEKVYVEKETRSPGGNGINAARILDRLGAPVTASGFLGGGIGEELRYLLKQERLRQEFIEIRDDTRIGITVSSIDSHTQTRLSFPGPKIRPQEKRKLFSYFGKIPRGSIVIIGGSLPPGLEVQDLRRLLNLGHQKKMAMIVDCPGDILKALVKSQPLMIKPNLLEFQQMTGLRGTSLEAVIEEAKKMTKYIPLVCVSSVDDGAVLVTEQGAWFGRIPKIKINSVVGAGDSMVGAITAKIWEHGLEDPQDLLRWGLAASCASLSHIGTRLGSAREIKKYYKQTSVKKVRDFNE